LTECGMDDIVRMNICLRTGHRVLLLVKPLTATNPEELYDRLIEIPWEDYIDADGYISVNSSVENPFVRDSRFANLKAKDAIVDRIQQQRGRRPDSGPEQDRSVVFLYWRNDTCLVYLDTSGEPLSRRGFRLRSTDAPMQETLAAAVVLATGWEGTGPFVNPMCGSGTLAIEAALVGINRAPGLKRKNFGFMHLRGFRRDLLPEVENELMRAERDRFTGRIIATDSDGASVEAARRNAQAAGVGHLIEFAVCDFAETEVPGGAGVVVVNPPYGKRMGRPGELEDTYRRIGDFFKKRCLGYRGFIFTGSPGLAKSIGLRPKRRMQFFNGPIESRLLEFELYEGSRKRERRTEG
jgi:23S rRNA G2445 N2-methylase RlmL